MRGKVLWGVGVLAVGLGIGFFGLVPRFVDDRMNPVTAHAPYPLSAEARALHNRAFIADMHADPLLWRRDLGQRNSRGMIDIPRLRAGNVAIQVFGVVTKSPKGLNYDANGGDSDNITLLAIAGLWPVKTWGSLFERALYQADKLRRLADASGGQLRVVASAAALDAVMAARARGEAVIAGLLGLEGAHALEGKLENVDRLFAAGYRMIGLAHFFDNEIAGSMHGVKKYGLTDLGRAVVRRAEELGMIIDVAHASEAAVDDMLAMARRPVIFSHGGVKGVCAVNRNLSDDQIRRIAAAGGLIALGAWDGAACGETPAHLARAMRYVRDLVGIEVVAIGSDFDGAIRAAFDATEYAALTQALLDEGFSDSEVEAALGGNALRFLRIMLPPR
ncbi:MAG: dipeptidase [Pseudomonadota bacterium]